MSQKTSQTVYYKDFNVKELEFTVPEENKWSKSQNIGYVRFNNGQLLLKSDFSELSSGGVPREDEYHPTDDKRRFIKIPENEESKPFFDKLREIDAILGSDEKKKEFFGKKASKYSYVPIVRTPMQDDDDEVVRPNYIKGVFCTKYPEGTITTNIFKCDSVESGTSKEKLDINTPDEAMKGVPYKSTNRYIISPVKTWAQPPKIKDPQYGLTFKVIQIETVHNSSSGGGFSKYLKTGEFIGDEENNTVFEKPQEKPVTKDSDSDSETEDSESDED